MLKYAAPTSRTVGTDDGQSIYVGEWPADAPAVVLAHGLTNQHRAFCGVAAMLDGQLRVVTPDLRGRGNSTAPPPGAYGMQRHATDVLAVMDTFGIERAIVGGHSMGAYVATAVATTAPERVAGLVLIDGGVYVPFPGLEDLDSLDVMHAIVGPVVERLGTSFATVEEYLDHWRSSEQLDGSWGAAIESDLVYDLQATPDGYRPRCSSEAASEDWRDLLENPRTQERLTEITCPMLAIAAEYGLSRDGFPILGEVHQEVLREMVPDVEIVTVPGTTHHTLTLSDQGEDAVAHAIAKFAARLG